MNRDRAVELATTLLAGVLFVLSAAGLAVAVQSGDGLVSAVFGVYLTALLLAGVLRDIIDTPRWQVAFFAGVAVWGGYGYLTTGDLLSALLAVAGVVIVAANLLDLR
ncbi:hypothetical protein [Halorussus caseinilyticus]|uniref:Phosphatidate cytidylyltransferase n=1 Tax=Halorussus caseinilyticus TaxID=3034025 RepID=A0ABD5WPL9_9EURY|nr:hypothetical protein [Halorussus sp. DT72]